jgi:hypothetical protein
MQSLLVIVFLNLPAVEADPCIGVLHATDVLAVT